MAKRLAYLGPTGTYTEQVALLYDSQAVLMSRDSVSSVMTAVESGDADEGIIPIENSLEGPVTSTVDLLIHVSNLMIRHERVLKIEHCLLTKPNTSRDLIKSIYSHPQALAQCRKFLGESFAQTQLIATLSTSSAVEQMLQSDATTAAIANERCASIYGVEIVEKNVEDDSNNQTRFVVMATSDHVPTGSDKTSICFDFDSDSPGILYTVLGEFAKRSINLTKIESRPMRKTLGRYIFLVDLEGHREDDSVKEALQCVENHASLFKVFGSYPMQVSSSL